MMLSALVPLFFFTFVTAVHADQECAPVDHRNSKCLPKYKNQSDTDFCYAFAAAEMASFKLCREVSPMALGLGNLKRKKTHQWVGTGGFPDEAIQVGNSNGYCLESELPSQVVINNDAFATRRIYENLLKKYEQTSSTNEKVCYYLRRGDIRDILPGIDMLKILKFISNDEKSLDDLHHLAEERCKNKISAEIELTMCSGNENEKLEYLDQNIARGPIALAATRGPTVPSWIAGHANTLVGRELDTNGECIYIVRDSDSAYRTGSMKVGNEGPIYHRLTRNQMKKALSAPEFRCYAVKNAKIR